jgi:hypothetical protein
LLSNGLSFNGRLSTAISRRFGTTSTEKNQYQHCCLKTTSELTGKSRLCYTFYSITILDFFMMFRKTVLSVSMSAVMATLAGCGGGGGGGGAGGGGGYLRADVPYHTPVRVATAIDPLTRVDGAAPVFDIFNANITGSGNDIILAGRQTQFATPETWSNSKITLMAWENGSLVDRTAQWFPGGINEILGTEPSVKFADLFNTGRQDMLVAPSTDMRHYGPGYVFSNQSTHFNRIAIPLNNVWAHDSAIADMDGDGFKDLLFVDYGPNTTLAINNRVNNFTAYTDPRGNAGDLRWGGSSIVADDFLQNGQKQIVVTDNSCNVANPACSDVRTTKMYSYTIVGGALNYQYVGDLPAPLLDHSVRAVSHDFNTDGRPDVIVFSRPGDYTIKRSAIQFLANQGSGSFTDVTSTTLVNYDTNTYSTYNPKFLDINGDGRTDILVSAWDFSGTHNSTQILLKSSDGKYVAAHQNIFKDFLKQAAAMTTGLGNGANEANSTVNIFQAPDGKFYLVTMIVYESNNDRKMAVYMSQMGTQTTLTAQAAVDLVRQRWPYMSTASANAVLAQTAATYWNGSVIDLEAALRPVGPLSIGAKLLSGHVSGIDIGSGQMMAMDALQRPFMINARPMNVTGLDAFQRNNFHGADHDLSTPAEFLTGARATVVNGLRVAGDRTTTEPGTGQYSIGIPAVWRSNNWAVGSQYTRLNFNPWVSFSGVWGSVRSSSVFDNVVSYRQGGFVARASLMYVTTDINPGLITRVSPTMGTWAETGYRWGNQHNDMGVYFGQSPRVISGSVEANVPTSFDTSGQLVYTKQNLDIMRTATYYVRGVYSKKIDKHTQFRFNAATSTTGQYRIMNELLWSFN